MIETTEKQSSPHTERQCETGKSYAVQWAETPNGPWHVDEVVTATTSQKRVVFPKPSGPAFYRVILAQ